MKREVHLPDLLKQAMRQVSEEESRALAEYERLRDIYWQNPTLETLEPMLVKLKRQIRLIKDREKIQAALRW